MTYKSDGRSGGDGAEIAIIVGALIFFGALGGTGAVLYRGRVAIQAEKLAVEQARAAAYDLEHQASLAAERINKPEMSVAAESDEWDEAGVEAVDAEVLIDLGSDGSIQVAGAPLQVDELADLIDKSAPASGTEKVFLLRVHPDCTFRRVAIVLQLCQNAGIRPPRFVAADE